jgi:hypothetical protein
MLSYFPDPKDPEARVAYRFDFTKEFRAAGETLAMSDVVVVTNPESTSDIEPFPTLNILDKLNHPSGIVTFLVDGGIVGQTYWIRCRVFGASLSPQQYQNDRTVGLRVEQL